jgi:hypothetical protein
VRKDESGVNKRELQSAKSSDGNGAGTRTVSVGFLHFARRVNKCEVRRAKNTARRAEGQNRCRHMHRLSRALRTSHAELRTSHIHSSSPIMPKSCFYFKQNWCKIGSHTLCHK